MEYSYKELKISITNGDERIKNYFDTFGYVVIRGVLSDSEFKEMLREYDRQYELRTGEMSIWRMILNRLGFLGPKRYGFREVLRKIRQPGGMRFLPNFVDGSEVYTSHFLSKRYQEMYSYFAGKNWLYLGSDGSNFITTSFPWHRDWFTRIPILKFNFYYNPLPFFGGHFLIIPGTNFAQDTYAQMVQKTMSWPMQNRKPGGLSENDRIHPCENPRAGILERWFGSSTEKQIKVPHVKLKVGRGDLILFDHRAVHCVQNNFPRFQRRLMTVLLSKNAFDFKANHYLLERNSASEVMSEIVDLVVGERNHIGCPPYGLALSKTDFVNSTHYIDISKSVSSDKLYDRGSFIKDDGEIFVSTMDFKRYEAIGKSYRQKSLNDNAEVALKIDNNTSEFGYADVHLGINAQNIRNLSP